MDDTNELAKKIILSYINHKYITYKINMKKILKFLLIVQEISNNKKRYKLGRGFDKAYRVNPFNPLSYVLIIIVLISLLLMFGFIGMWNQTNLRNPFKWY